MMVRGEIKDLNRSDGQPSVIVEKVCEDAEGYARHAPGSGFTWYLEDNPTPG